jgi:BirA family biotin operon repressor/biotin-[acetyl-CoA-carboxylase] ligase
MQLEQAEHGRFQNVSWVSSTASTNTDLVAVARSAPGKPCVLFTDLQTAGRGRRNRSWDMPPAQGLLVSFYVPWPSAAEAHVIPTSLGVAAVDAIADVGRHVGLKWPNDIVSMEDKKVGGMLSEVVSVDGVFAGVVAGLGCNVSWPDPHDVDLPQATNLDVIGDGMVDREGLARALIAAFDVELDRVQTRGSERVYERYRVRCRTIGTMVRVERGDHSFTGMATDVSSDGSLVMTVDGVQRRIDVGDVVHLRPVGGEAD